MNWIKITPQTVLPEDVPLLLLQNWESLSVGRAKGNVVLVEETHDFFDMSPADFTHYALIKLPFRYRLDFDPPQVNYNGKGDDLPGKAYMFDTVLNRRLTQEETEQLKAKTG